MTHSTESRPTGSMNESGGLRPRVKWYMKSNPTSWLFLWVSCALKHSHLTHKSEWNLYLCLWFCMSFSICGICIKLVLSYRKWIHHNLNYFYYWLVNRLTFMSKLTGWFVNLDITSGYLFFESPGIWSGYEDSNQTPDVPVRQGMP